MQRTNVLYNNNNNIPVASVPREKEVIHSGQFMVSHFEAEEQDDEDELAVPVPEEGDNKNIEMVRMKNNKQLAEQCMTLRKSVLRPQIGIDTSLAKLFQCMSLAYRQKLTSPKWNRFRGIRLRWKDKIRLNNVIWRCWHMQFIERQNTLICQFASPLDVDTHNKPEAVVLEGKYWKRKLAAVTAEYKKWRMFYRNQLMGHTKDINETLELELLSWNNQAMEENMLVDEDYMGMMSDTLFSTITNQPFMFPDTREIAKAGLADFIQPSLGPLQPNLDDYMDTFEPLHDFMSARLPSVPEEQAADQTLYKNDIWFPDYATLNPSSSTSANMSVPQAGNLSMNAFPSTDSVQMQPIVGYNEMASLYNPIISKLPQKPSTAQVGIKELQQTVCIHSQLQDTQDVNNFNASHQSQTKAYKFRQPSPANIKFTSQSAATSFSSATHDTKKDDNSIGKPRTSNRGRPRSRSHTREPIKKPPLLSAVSDPSLVTTNNSALLTQLLKNHKDSSAAAVIANQRVIMPLDRKSYIRVKEENVPIPILPQTTPTTLILTPVSMTPIGTAVNIEPILLNNLNPPAVADSGGLNSPTPSQESLGSPTRESNRDHRRAGHIHAEQKRRYNIKNGFDMLHSLIPQLNQNSNTKLSKAAMLQKGADYIKQLRSERNTLKDEMDSLRQQIETLNASISNCQSLLPATGAPVSRRQDNKLEDMFDDYVRRRTLEDWKFWIFSLLFRPLLTSFNNVVSTTSLDDLYRSTLSWAEQHCTLVDLRPVVLNSLRYLCTKTDILSNPEKLPEEARQIVQSRQTQAASTAIQ